MKNKEKEKKKAMLKIQCEEHYVKVLAFATKTGKFEDLRKNLDYLDTYADQDKQGLTECLLFSDFAPNSFHFIMNKKNSKGDYVRWFNGGLIFHGSHDGYGSGEAPTLAVTVNPTDGWSIHT